MKVLTIIGTRPEAIKVFPVIEELKKFPNLFESILCTTGQHQEMLNQVLTFFNIKPDLELNLMEPNQSLFCFTKKVFESLDSVLQNVNPDWVLVQGDTTSAMVASLLAYYRKIKVGHIEAGLRTYDKLQPFPEEFNRRSIDLISDLFFAPTQRAFNNLISEGVNESRICIVGNTVVDAINYIVKKLSIAPKEFKEGEKKIILVTIHRRENFGEPLVSVCKALIEIANYFPNIEIVFPVHLNPNIQSFVYKFLIHPQIKLLNPLNYFEFIKVLSNSYLVLTDSGGVQEEAPSFNKPVLVLRNATERPEGVEIGIARLVGADTNLIVRSIKELLLERQSYIRMVPKANPYGDGTAAKQICDFLWSHK